MKVINVVIVRHESEGFEPQAQILLKIPLSKLNWLKAISKEGEAMLGKDLLEQVTNKLLEVS